MNRNIFSIIKEQTISRSCPTKLGIGRSTSGVSSEKI